MPRGDLCRHGTGKHHPVQGVAGRRARAGRRAGNEPRSGEMEAATGRAVEAGGASGVCRCRQLTGGEGLDATG
eukprot:4012062-Prymnesium_polylepis.1